MDVLTTEHKNLGSNPTINDRAVTSLPNGLPVPVLNNFMVSQTKYIDTNKNVLWMNDVSERFSNVKSTYQYRYAKCFFFK